MSSIRCEVKSSLYILWRHMGGSRGIAPLILNLGFRWKYVLNITLRPLYYRKRTPRRRSKWFLKKRKSLAPAGIRTPGSSARSQSLYRLRYLGCHKFYTDKKCAIVYFSVSQYRFRSPGKVQSTNPWSVVWPTSITYTTYLSYARMSLLPPTRLQMIC